MVNSKKNGIENWCNNTGRKDCLWVYLSLNNTKIRIANFYKQLHLENEVECAIQDGALVIRPIHQGNGEFSLEILKDLVAQGYSGDDLVHRFEGESKNIRKAIGVLLEEAEQLASGEKPAATFEDIFGTENFYEELKRLYKK